LYRRDKPATKEFSRVYPSGSCAAAELPAPRAALKIPREGESIRIRVVPNHQRIRLDSRSPASSLSWSCQPGEPEMFLECDGTTRRSVLRNRKQIVRTWDDPLAALGWMAEMLREVPDPRARWIGYLSYDLGRLFEMLPTRAEDDLRLPLFAFSYHDTAPAAPSNPPPAPTPVPPHADPYSNFTRDAYLAAVRRCIDYIAAGDVFQINLSQRFTTTLTEPPALIYQRLCRQSPAAYGAFLDHLDYALLCNSPELFLRVDPPNQDGIRKVTTRPIKGTRARGMGMEAELRESEKDRAELTMIVDLERNDLGRICEIASVKVAEPRVIESHPTLYHGAATIKGILRPDVTFVDLLRATFPGGSVTGAPKIRAMQIIEELESTRRGPYCGAIGYLAADGAIELNVAIRTMIVKDNLVHIPVGGGIVADSDPVSEYAETLVKARAMFAALGIDGSTLHV
jgi:para-aminobenzoate synthetase component 1